MIKSIILDFVVLSKLGIRPVDLLYLIWLKDENLISEELFYEFDPSRLIDLAYIKIDKKGHSHLRQSAIDLIQYLSIDSFKEFKEPKIVKKSKKKIKVEVLDRIDEYRDLWRGIKTGAMGDRQACITKLSRWMETNPSYSFEDILKAAQLYLSTEGANIKYLQRADYFIYKEENNKDESSRLSAFIDEINTTTKEDWTSVLN